MTGIGLRNAIRLHNRTEKGEQLEAVFLPEQGMNLCSYKLDDVEVIDQQTWNLFEERYAGLGALIGPHFHHRRKEVIPALKDETIFPHIAALKAKGVAEPFSHGIARYVPWKATATANRIDAQLDSKDEYKGVAISALEGQQFKMRYQAELTPRGLQIHYSVASDTDCVIGLHYYYALYGSSARVISRVQDRYNDQGTLKPIPREWNLDAQGNMDYDLSRETDYGFKPFPDPLSAQIKLMTGRYALHVGYSCQNEENSWQLYHPSGASFACIEPLSAADPRKPQLTASSLKVSLRIEKHG